MRWAFCKTIQTGYVWVTKSMPTPKSREREERVRTRNLGRTGLRVSELCLGTLTFGHQADEATAFNILDAGVEGGITFFDSADVYPSLAPPELAGTSETILGRWLAARGGRDRFVIAAKVYNRMGPGPNDVGLGRKHLIRVRRVCAACRPTISTRTRPTRSTRRCLSRRRYVPSTIWSPQAR